MIAWTERAIDTIESLAGIRSGGSAPLRLAVDEEERHELRTEYEALVAAGFAAEWIRASSRRSRVGSRLHCTTYPTECCSRLAGCAGWPRSPRRPGSRAEHTRVASLEELGGATVVVCTDGYPSGLLGEIEGLIIPTRGQVIATEPVPERYFEVPHYGRHGFDYWHQAEDGRIVAGGFRDVSFDSEFTADEQLTEPVQTALHRFVNDLMGRELRVDYAWAGIFGMVMDFLPVVGRVPGLDDVWVAGGYSGHGNVLGFACGELVASAVLGNDEPLLPRSSQAGCSISADHSGGGGSGGGGGEGVWGVGGCGEG